MGLTKNSTGNSLLNNDILVKNNFDLTPQGIINRLNLRTPIYRKTTNYGHFGKKELSWEEIIKL